MASSHAATAALRGSERAGRLAPRTDGLIVALIIAALLAALTSVYFNVSAGGDYPEPSVLIVD